MPSQGWESLLKTAMARRRHRGLKSHALRSVVSWQARYLGELPAEPTQGGGSSGPTQSGGIPLPVSVPGAGRGANSRQAGS